MKRCLKDDEQEWWRFTEMKCLNPIKNRSMIHRSGRWQCHINCAFFSCRSCSCLTKGMPVWRQGTSKQNKKIAKTLPPVRLLFCYLLVFQSDSSIFPAPSLRLRALPSESARSESVAKNKWNFFRLKGNIDDAFLNELKWIKPPTTCLVASIVWPIKMTEAFKRGRKNENRKIVQCRLRIPRFLDSSIRLPHNSLQFFA